MVWSQDGRKAEGDILYRKRQSGVWLPSRTTRNCPALRTAPTRPTRVDEMLYGHVCGMMTSRIRFQAGYSAIPASASGAWLFLQPVVPAFLRPYPKARELAGGHDGLTVSGGQLGGERTSTCTAGTPELPGAHPNWGGGTWWRWPSMNGVARLACIDTAAGELFYSTYDSATNAHSAPQLVSAGAGTMKVDAAAMCMDAQGSAWMAWEERKGEWPGTSTLLFSTNSSAGAPADVVSFTARPGNGLVRLYWTNPGSPNYSGTMVCFRTDRFPENPQDGSLVVDPHLRPGIPNHTRIPG